MGSNVHVFPFTGTAEPIDVQTFSASGTWTKPSRGSWALIEVIGAGGGGARRSSGNGSGGGCGGYVAIWKVLSDLGATETVTIGAGGAVQSTDNTDGNNGGNTSFGSHITMYGGRGGDQAAAGSAVSGGGGGSPVDIWTAGALVASSMTLVGINTQGNVGLAQNNMWGAAATGVSAANAVHSTVLSALIGPAGGSGHSSSGPASGLTNTSESAGDGGAGNGAGAGGNGGTPGGGGGSGTTQGGSGGDGEITVTVI